jgi:hydroxyacylglutathione hydrolase
MLLRQFYDNELAQASYVIGCPATGDAIVVDPLRDIAPYLALASDEGLRVTGVAETHIHADFVSGARELAARSGATLYLSGEGGDEWRYRYAAEPPVGSETVTLLRDGDRIAVGNVMLDVLHTPGHTPEHLAFLVTDTPSAAGPMGLLSGDFVFVGDVGRPDLPERAAGASGTMEDSARALFRSLERFRALPDHLQVWPGHGAGAAYGTALGAVPSTTVGYEKLANWALAERDEARFVSAVLDGQPEPPRYFAEMKRVNRDGPRPMAALQQPVRLDPDTIVPWVNRRAWLLDLRPGAVFAGSHVPTAVSLPYGRSFTGWAGTVVPYDAEILLLTDNGAASAAARALRMIGLDTVVGWMDATDAATSWRSAGHALAALSRQDIRTIAPTTGMPFLPFVPPWPIVDVREDREWHEGHLPGARHISLGRLASGDAALPAGPFAVHCQSGARSIIAASLLQRAGREDAIDLTGGYAAWSAAGLPTTRDP